MFSNASNFVQGVDFAFLFIVGISVFFLILLTGLMIFFVIKYNKNRHPKAEQVKDNMWMEATWTGIPLILVLVMFYFGWEGFLPMRQVPDNAMKVKAIGQMWKWTFEYEGNKQSDTLVLPINQPVKVDLVSTDVLHAFSVPAFRIKEDVVPVKNNYTWFIPGELGEFDLFCTVYCGLSHSYMNSIIKIVPQAEYDKWIAALPVKKDNSGNLGYKVMEKNGCLACHSVDGSKLVGPSFKGSYGSTIQVKTNGVARQVTFDDAYIETSINEPNKDISGEYPPGVMKSYQGTIKPEEMQQIKDYLKTLK